MRAQQVTQLDLEHLGDRIVPAVLDLTTKGAVAELANGALVQQTDAQPTGTGHIQSFVRVQGAASGGGTQQGFNTDARPLQFQENKSPQFTRSLTLGEVPVVTVNGVRYREFLLDVNQKSSAPLISLDEVRVYLGGAGNLTGYDALTKTLAGQTAAFDLDAGGDVSVLLNARLNSGSGAGDMKLLIPDAYFAGQGASSYVYLFSKMGGVAGATANGGFEEWAVRDVPSDAPAGTGRISGRVFFDDNQNGALDGDLDFALAGVVIHLRGTNDLGQTVDLVVLTDEFGYFTFAGLRAGTYTMWEEQPLGYEDGADYVGSAGGQLAFAPGTDREDAFENIQLLDGDEATGYVFTERSNESST